MGLRLDIDSNVASIAKDTALIKRSVLVFTIVIRGISPATFWLPIVNFLPTVDNPSSYTVLCNLAPWRPTPTSVADRAARRIQGHCPSFLLSRALILHRARGGYHRRIAMFWFDYRLPEYNIPSLNGWHCGLCGALATPDAPYHSCPITVSAPTLPCGAGVAPDVKRCPCKQSSEHS
jgi:hypothetical protein